MPKVNNVIQQVSQLNTYEQGKVFEFLKNVLMSNGITNSVNEEIAESRFNKGSVALFAIMTKYLSMERNKPKKFFIHANSTHSISLIKDFKIRIPIYV